MTSNYEKFFGSPERVAVTVAAVEEWVRRDIQLNPHPDGDESKEWYDPTAYYLLGETLDVNFGDSAVTFLEWLEGDAE